MSNSIKKVCLIVGLSFGVISVDADVWSEREALSKIEIELETLKVLIKSAKSQSEPSRRTQFDYGTLLNDVDKIRSGISSHLKERMLPTLPSKIDALNTQYTERQQ